MVLSLADELPSFNLTVLTEKQRVVIEMRYCGGMRWERIAESEGVSPRAVRFRHERALGKLRDQVYGSPFHSSVEEDTRALCALALREPVVLGPVATAEAGAGQRQPDVGCAGGSAGMVYDEKR